MEEIIQKLKQKLEEVDSLAQEPAYSAKYKIWNTSVERLLKKCLDEEMIKIFTGVLVISSYASSVRAHQMYINHLDKKQDALKNLIDMLESDYEQPVVNEKEKEEIPDIKRKRKTTLGFNTGLFKGSIEEERDLQ
ncbi:MAG: hypothetical protein HOA57_01275 [Candidatus Magasanikbacteria bacterium]|jgi:hypothetical protein|nr:hypothetical protein [Candidatus Magasanikbacteria bacterium]MBT4315052.1 hypothetical protein [Candidatus Magasanikbacteria bacterium]MBT4546831.1 hypothetical protein [Candidatus Magasanikbacteria bacterium]MBT6818996.1 hypothetical protein [Candidatus Magasanikbacteria bacterium]